LYSRLDVASILRGKDENAAVAGAFRCWNSTIVLGKEDDASSAWSRWNFYFPSVSVCWMLSLLCILCEDALLCCCYREGVVGIAVAVGCFEWAAKLLWVFGNMFVLLHIAIGLEFWVGSIGKILG